MRKAKDGFHAALIKCEAEINAGTAALKEAAKVDETDLKDSKQESGKKQEKQVGNEELDEIKERERERNGKRKENESVRNENVAK